MSVWILVADASRARFFSADRPVSPLKEVTDLIHPEGRMHDSQLTTDTDTRGRAPKGTGSHGPGDAPSIKSDLANRFARNICSMLEDFRAEGKFRRLYVVASPAFLGILRKCRSLNVEKLVVAEIAKDLCTLSPREIRDHLPQYL